VFDLDQVLEAREPFLKGKAPLLLLLIRLDQLIFILKTSLMRRSTVLSLPLQLVFHAEANVFNSVQLILLYIPMHFT
jgi:hypothetical protein